MIFLRNFDFAVKYYEYESRIEVTKTVTPKINGWYKFINGSLSGLLVIDSKLYLLDGENKFLITDSSKALIKEKNAVEDEFYFKDEYSNKVITFFYSKHMPISPFEYLDEEDFEWGNFVATIINDRERKMNFINKLMEY